MAVTRLSGLRMRTGRPPSRIAPASACLAGGALLLAGCAFHPPPPMPDHGFPVGASPGDIQGVAVPLALVPADEDGVYEVHVKDFDAGPDTISSAYLRLEGTGSMGWARRLHGDREVFDLYPSIDLELKHGNGWFTGGARAGEGAFTVDLEVGWIEFVPPEDRIPVPWDQFLDAFPARLRIGGGPITADSVIGLAPSGEIHHATLFCRP